MRQFWRTSLYSGLAALVASTALLVYSEVVRDELLQQESRYDAGDEALARGGAPFEERAAARDGHEVVMRPKRLFQGRLEIGGLVALMAGLVLTVFGALAPGAKRSKRRANDPFADGEDQGW